jgi:excisionase family DNA binding protein
MSPSPDLMTRDEAAVYLGVSVSWLAHGNGPPSLRLGRKVKYSRKAIDRWIDEQGVQQCSTEKRAEASGSSSSSTAGRRSVSPQAKRIAAELRSKVAASESTTSKRPALVVVGRGSP